MRVQGPAAAIMLGLVVVMLAIGRSMPRSIQGGRSVDMAIPLLGALVVAMFVLILLLRNRSHGGGQKSSRRRGRR